MIDGAPVLYFSALLVPGERERWSLLSARLFTASLYTESGMVSLPALKWQSSLFRDRQ